MAVHYSDYPQRFFIRRVGDQIILHTNETQRMACEVGTALAAMGERNQAFNGDKNFASSEESVGY